MRNFRLVLLATVVACPSVATAQTASDDADAAQADSNSIIVTAQRFEQRLQDVPLSITAVSDEELNARNVSSLSDMQYAVPGLSSFEYGPGQQYVQIRGVSNAFGSPTVGIYLDEMPVTLDVQGGSDLRLLDLERVEVLRGPQATLYGEGSMGGTIRYITAKPDLYEVTGFIEGDYGFTKDGEDSYRATGVVSVPLVTDKLGVRLVASQERIGGYIDNLVTGASDINRTDVLTLRGTILARPTDRFTLTFIGLHSEVDQDNQDFGVNRKTSTVAPSPNNQNYDLLQGIAEYDFDAATLTATAGYLDKKSFAQYDVSPFYVPFLTAPAPFGLELPVGFITEVPLLGYSEYEIFNSEIRLASDPGKALRWLVGTSYRHIDASADTFTETAPNTLPFDILASDSTRDSKSYAIYGELAYSVTPQLTILAGLRYAEEKKDQVNESVSFGFPSADVNQGTFNTLNPRFNIQYEISPNSMVYANIAKGFRSGGFNLTSAGGGVVTIPPTYDPDEIWTYELGTKQSLAGNRLFLDAVVYYSDWKGVQSSQFAPGSAITIVTNGGKVSGWGTEVGVTAKPAAGLTLTGTYGWNNLEYKEDTADKLAGDPVDNAVRETWSASLDYRAPVFGDTEAFFRADYQHAASAQITLRNFGGQIIDRPGRDLVNLRAGVDLGMFELSVYAQNVFDEDAPNIVGPFGVLLENLEQRPRVIGVNGRVKF